MGNPSPDLQRPAAADLPRPPEYAPYSKDSAIAAEAEEFAPVHARPPDRPPGLRRPAATELPRPPEQAPHSKDSANAAEAEVFAPSHARPPEFAIISGPYVKQAAQDLITHFYSDLNDD